MVRGIGPIAELGATSRRQTGRDARPTNRAFLIANTRSLDEFPVHPQASIHPGQSFPPPPPRHFTHPFYLLPFSPPRHIYCEEFRFPSVVFPPARPFADWRRISDNITDAGVASVHTRESRNRETM